MRVAGRRRWVGSDPAPAPTDSPTEAADMQATAAAAVLFLAGETINPETDEGFTACRAPKPFPSHLSTLLLALFGRPLDSRLIFG